MSKSYRTLLLSVAGVFIFMLSGCSNTTPIDENSTGIWDHYFVYQFSRMIQFITEHIPGGNYGVAIIIITLLIRFVIIPLSISQYRSQIKLKKMQPELKKLKEKYGDIKNDLTKQQEYQKEMAELMKTTGWNPVMGCLPLLIQLPIFSALYYAISRTEEIRTSSFLWTDLGHADPYYILPIIAAFTTFIQMKIMKSMNAAEEQMPLLKMQQFIMPVIILSMGIFAPAGLVIYWITGNLFIIVQTIILEKTISRKEKSAD